ncbi:MAG: hypothetical protein ACD_62C00444G0004 [uncultured bacterium]|nr:MAG: hypothetical protein ACD_62C00444G0004 [uncultured bacterium]
MTTMGPTRFSTSMILAELGAANTILDRMEPNLADIDCRGRPIDGLANRQGALQLKHAAYNLEQIIATYPDGSLEYDVAHRALRTAIANCPQFTEIPAVWANTLDGKQPSVPLPCRYPQEAGLFRYLFEGLDHVSAEAGFEVKWHRGLWGLGKPAIVIKFPCDTTQRYPLELIFQYLCQTSTLRIYGDGNLVARDLKTGVLRRSLNISRDGADEEQWIPGIGAIAETVIDPTGTTITINLLSDKAERKHNLFAEYLSRLDPGDLTEAQIQSTLQRPFFTLPLPDYIAAVRRLIGLSGNRLLAVEAQRFGNSAGFTSPLYAQSRIIYYKMVRGTEDMDETMFFLSATLFSQFWGSQDQWPLGCFLRGSSGCYALIPGSGSGAVFSFIPDIPNCIRVSSAKPFSNDMALRAHDEVFWRLLTGEPFRDLSHDIAMVPDESGYYQPTVEQTLLVREEPLPHPPGDLGSVFPADQQHQRFHLLLNGGGTRNIPVSLNIQTGSKVNDWRITLAISPVYYNKASLEPLVLFLASLLGVKFRDDDRTYVCFGAAMPPSKSYLADVSGVGQISLKFYENHCSFFPLKEFELSIQPEAICDHQAAIDFMKNLFARIRGFARYSAV